MGFHKEDLLTLVSTMMPLCAAVVTGGACEVCHKITPKDKVLLLSLPCFLSISFPQHPNTLFLQQSFKGWLLFGTVFIQNISAKSLNTQLVTWQMTVCSGESGNQVKLASNWLKTKAAVHLKRGTWNGTWQGAEEVKRGKSKETKQLDLLSHLSSETKDKAQREKMQQDTASSLSKSVGSSGPQLRGEKIYFHGPRLIFCRLRQLISLADYRLQFNCGVWNYGLNLVKLPLSVLGSTEQNIYTMNWTTQRANLLGNTNRKSKQAVKTKDRQTGVKRNERNIPLSEGFEICFCLIESEREKRRRRESTDRDSEK